MAITVSYQELNSGSGDEHWARDGKGSVKRELLCDWNDRQLLRQQLLGGVRAVGTAMQRWEPPSKHPSFGYLYVSSVDISGVGVSSQDINGAIAWTKAKLSVSYEPLQLDEKQKAETPQVTYLTESQQVTAEVLTIPGDLLRWGDDAPGSPGPIPGQPVNGSEAIAFLRYPKLVYTLNIHQWLNPDLDTDTPLQEYVGYVNKGSFRPLWRNFKAGTLLYMGCSLERDFTNQAITDPLTGRAIAPSGAAFKVTLTFEWLREGWNKMLSKDGYFYTVYHGTSTPLYGSKDFSKLLP